VIVPVPVAVLIGSAVALGLFLLGWRWASRRWQLPCPTLLAWALESPLYGRFTGTQATPSRMELRPGQRVLEIGPGLGRLLIPAARQILPDGEAVGIDIQPGMIDRLKQRSADAGLTNLTAATGADA
jgi:tRNA G46 methylase TrmB